MRPGGIVIMENWVGEIDFRHGLILPDKTNIGSPSWYVNRIVPGSQAVTFPDFATCEDGLDYALKLDGTAHTHVRASEYVCCRLAEIVGLPLPNFRVVEHLNGDLVFASQIFGDIRQNAADQAGLLRFLTKNSPPPEIVTQMSRVYAFDLFVNNIDRHINNFMFQKQNKKTWFSLLISVKPYLMFGRYQMAR